MPRNHLGPKLRGDLEDLPEINIKAILKLWMEQFFSKSWRGSRSLIFTKENQSQALVGCSRKNSEVYQVQTVARLPIVGCQWQQMCPSFKRRVRCQMVSSGIDTGLPEVMERIVETSQGLESQWWRTEERNQNQTKRMPSLQPRTCFQSSRCLEERVCQSPGDSTVLKAMHNCRKEGC